MIGDRLGAVIPGDEGPVAAALINGEQSAIPQALQEAYRILKAEGYGLSTR